MIKEEYKDQVRLMLKILPYVAAEKVFALKGGTAINMFIWDSPRLSVDLDLTYVNFDSREAALANISSALANIREKLLHAMPEMSVTLKGANEDNDEKLFCRYKGVQVKIEVNTTMRGILYPTKLMTISPTTQQNYGLFADMNIVSIPELFGGKICAALDRQHPRDLFDINNLIINDGFTEQVKYGFIASLLSHPKAIHEILDPIFYNQESAFENQFFGMTDKKFTYADFENTRIILLRKIREMLTFQDKNFILSFKSGEPTWNLVNVEKLSDMPAIKWKLLNIRKLIESNPKRHTELFNQLKNTLNL